MFGLCSLEGHTLAQKLSWLLSDKEHLNSCFHDFAFLCRLQYSEAALICLRAVEENQLSLLTDIDPTLVSSTTYLLLNSSAAGKNVAFW